MDIKSYDTKSVVFCWAGATLVCYPNPRKYSTKMFKDGTTAIKAVVYVNKYMYNAWLPVFTEWWQ